MPQAAVFRTRSACSHRQPWRFVSLNSLLSQRAPRVLAGMQAGAELEAPAGRQRQQEQELRRMPPGVADGTCGSGGPDSATSAQQVGRSCWLLGHALCSPPAAAHPK